MIEGLLVDLDGVLVKDSELNIFEDAPLFIDFLHKNNIPFKIATNNSRRSPSEIADKLREKGLNVDEKDVVSPLSVAPEVLKERGMESIYIIGSQKLKDYFREKGFNVKDSENVDAVVIGMDKSLNFQKLKIATTAVKRFYAKIYALNKNLISQDDDGMLFPGVGSVAKMFAYACNTDFEHFGKMSDLYNDVIFKSLGKPLEKLGIISDDLFVDLKGYGSLGLTTIFVTTGKYKVEDIDDFEPDYIFDSLTEIIEFMGAS
ncbi:HAD-IIA family hydrolase [Persephonella sp.]